MKAKEPIYREQFLDEKRDYSDLLVHLTRESEERSAKEILMTILDERTLRAFNHFCIFDKNLKSTSCDILNTYKSKFNVVCFTETPVDQIEAVVQPLIGRAKQLEPYGLVFKKDYIRQQEGNPVFYVTLDIAKPLWRLYWQL